MKISATKVAAVMLGVSVAIASGASASPALTGSLTANYLFPDSSTVFATTSLSIGSAITCPGGDPICTPFSEPTTITASGMSITLNENAGSSYNSTSFNGMNFSNLVFNDGSSLTGYSLDTNLSGLTPANISFTPSSIEFNAQGLSFLGSPYHITLNLETATSSPPPTVAQLADLSRDAYSVLPLVTDGYVPIASKSFADGLFIRVSRNTDNSQIVFDIRGTNPSDAKNLLTDVAIYMTTSSALFSGYVAEAAQYLKEISTANLNSHITLSGHSLGGAIAQILGESSGADTVAFDAPGTAKIYPLYTDSWSKTLAQLGNHTENSNYRLYGDQISAFSDQVGAVYTVGTSGGPTSVNQFLHLVGVGDASHSIATLAADLQPGSGVLVQQGMYGPVYAHNSLTHLLAPLIYPLAEYVSAYDHYFGDPSGHSQFVVLSDPGSPYFNSLELPTLDGVAYFNLKYEIGNQWSDFSQLDGDTSYLFVPGVDGFEFDAMDQSGSLFLIPNTFLFDVTFSSSGDFSGSVTALPAPEPSSFFVFLTGAGSLLTFRRRKLKLNVPLSEGQVE